MRLDLHHKLIPVMQQLLRLVRKPDARRSAGNNNGALGQRCALREEADDLLDREDEIPKTDGVSQKTTTP
jgi:hypothetical protein